MTIQDGYFERQKGNTMNKTKKIICLLLLLVAAAALCACEAIKQIELPPLPTVTPTPEQMQAPAAEQSTATETQTQTSHPITVRFKNTEYNEYDPQNGTMQILSFSYDTPNTAIEGRDEAAARINEYTAMLEEAFCTGEDFGGGYGMGYMNMLTAAEDEYNYRAAAGEEESMYKYSSSLTVTAARADESVLSYVYREYNYTGGAHGSYVQRGYSFDTESGKLLTLAELSADEVRLRASLLEVMLRQIENAPEIKEEIESYTAQQSELSPALEALIREGSWYFDSEGMVIFSDLYEISSYAAGIISIHIPYSELEDILDDRWKPETRAGEGSFVIVAEENMREGSTPIIDMVKTADEGRKFYLVALGEVYDVTISEVGYSGMFYDKSVLWYRSELSHGAIQMSAVLPEGIPNLKISWKDARGEYSSYISENGKDGALMLVGEDIEAVG